MLLWIPHSWKDDYLVWNASEWDGITRVNIPADQLWLPDGTIFNILDVKESIPISRIFARITSEGRVEVDLNKLVDVRCPMDVRRFPFDQQICDLQFGSWGFQIHQLTHHVKDTFVPKHKGNSEWEIVSFTARKQIAAYENSMGDAQNEYEEVFYTLVLRRKPLYYVVVILIPTYLIVTVSIIGLFIAHSADGEREEKVSLGLTTLLTMAVVLDMVSGQMPRSSAGLPLLGKNYFLFWVSV
ncbi:unnamed protein product [Toxocara canis]|uniref:Neur_chan_LBD domain-containing protein n=1 Tax=Toxocara canis TaxID=6265 RepID=A0A3P7G1J9_TOXCA|nr:unnamed protein product [Toxocara canis]